MKTTFACPLKISFLLLFHWSEIKNFRNRLILFLLHPYHTLIDREQLPLPIFPILEFQVWCLNGHTCTFWMNHAWFRCVEQVKKRLGFLELMNVESRTNIFWKWMNWLFIYLLFHPWNWWNIQIYCSSNWLANKVQY